MVVILEINGITTKKSGRVKDFNLKVDSGKIMILLCADLVFLRELEDVFYKGNPLSKGHITIQGKSIYDVEDKLIIGNRDSIFDELSVLDNILLSNSKNIWLNKRKEKKRLKGILKGYNIDIGLDQLARDLDVEKRKMVELLRGHMFNPSLLVVNELLNHISQNHIPIVRHMLNDLKDAGVIILYMTSKWEEAIKLADEICVYGEDKCIYEFSIDDALSNPQQLYNAILGKKGLEEFEGVKRDDTNILDIINVGTKYILSEYSLNNALLKIMKIVESYFEEVTCSVFMKEPQKEVFTCYSNHDTYSPLSESVFQEVLASKKMYCATQKEKNFSKNKDIGTVIVLPVYQRGNDEVVFQVIFRKYKVIGDTEVAYLLGVSREIGMLIENTRLLTKSTLFQESHHRIKNNLQLVMSLLQVQKYKLIESIDELDEEKIDRSFMEMEYRTKCIASVHDLLSKDTNNGQILSLYRMIDEIRLFYNHVVKITIKIDEQLVVSHSKSTSIALVVNELISNSIKHNQGIKESLGIEIKMEVVEDCIYIVYKDSGKGFDLGAENDDIGIGMSIIKSIIENEFEGTIDMINDNGACTTMIFRKEQLVNTYKF